MHYFRTTELAPVKEQQSLQTSLLLTKSLAFTEYKTDQNQRHPFTIVFNTETWLKYNQSKLPAWVQNFVRLYCNQGAIFNFNFDQCQGWYIFTQHNQAEPELLSDSGYYLSYLNQFPITRYKDIVESELHDLVPHHDDSSQVLTTGWPFEFHIGTNSFGFYSLKKADSEVNIFRKLVPGSFKINILIQSAIIGEALSAYIQSNQGSLVNFVTKEDFSSHSLLKLDLNQLCLGSRAFPDTIRRNLISKLDSISAKLPAQVLSLIQY